jgi:hypothetical protein
MAQAHAPIGAESTFYGLYCARQCTANMREWLTGPVVPRAEAQAATALLSLEPEEPVVVYDQTTNADTFVILGKHISWRLISNLARDAIDAGFPFRETALNCAFLYRMSVQYKLPGRRLAPGSDVVSLVYYVELLFTGFLFTSPWTRVLPPMLQRCIERIISLWQRNEVSDFFYTHLKRFVARRCGVIMKPLWFQQMHDIVYSRCRVPLLLEDAAPGRRYAMEDTFHGLAVDADPAALHDVYTQYLRDVDVGTTDTAYARLMHLYVIDYTAHTTVGAYSVQAIVLATTEDDGDDEPALLPRPAKKQRTQ